MFTVYLSNIILVMQITLSVRRKSKLHVSVMGYIAKSGSSSILHFSVRVVLVKGIQILFQLLQIGMVVSKF